MRRSRIAALVALLAADGRATALPQTATAGATASPLPQPSSSPAPSPSPTGDPTPRFRLIPYAFGGVKRDPTPSDLLRFEDQAEVRALEMNEAIARFFEDEDTFTRGATGGADRAPSRDEMNDYRPGMSPSINLLLLPKALMELGKMLKRREDARKPMPPAQPTPEPTPVPDILADATPTPTPSPTPTPR